MAEQTLMFPGLAIEAEPIISFQRLERPLWTENKAKLIARYLHYFVFVTKHGTYIDGFAGPQQEKKEGAEEMWSARLVLANKPRWLRKFYLFDISPEQIDRLQHLVSSEKATDDSLRKQGERFPKRTYSTKQGDFNVAIDDLLSSGEIRAKEATFALLDQRSLECNWKTVEKLAHYCSPPHNKIEIFYFLATGWLLRTISNHGDVANVDAWWGRQDWRDLPSTGTTWANEMTRRFKEELGYRYVMAWPIQKGKRGTGRVMYYMIHATDHPEAPKLMRRAYKHVLDLIDSDKQLDLGLSMDPLPEVER